MKTTDIKTLKSFKDLDSSPINGGIQYKVKFSNNYGASIVKHDFSYGNAKGLWELAVLNWINEADSLCYTTPITNDVLGYLTEDEVMETLIK